MLPQPKKLLIVSFGRSIGTSIQQSAASKLQSENNTPAQSSEQKNSKELRSTSSAIGAAKKLHLVTEQGSKGKKPAEINKEQTNENMKDKPNNIEAMSGAESK